MLKVSIDKWNQSAEILRELALHHEHPRTRERFLALYEITTGKTATQISRETGRNHQTVIGWVHKYNQEGHESLFYQNTGGKSVHSLQKNYRWLGYVNQQMVATAPKSQPRRDEVFTPPSVARF
ncbi:MAG: helix-turn-helix domain containing protein [Methylococcales bacterium]|nr:helix-turn-helix domain containing protein [Methylococcales bacterium]